MASPLPADIQAVVDRAVSDRRYESAEEFLRAAVQLLDEHERGASAYEEFRQKVAAGVAQLDAGLGRKVSAEASIARARAKWADRNG